MKKIVLFFALFITSAAVYAQVKFTNGYFINNGNERVECLIQDFDWQQTPYSFNYKLTAESEKEVGIIDSIKEFGIGDVVKYIRYNGKMDRSSNRVEELTTNRNPVFNEETLFLKVLIEGKANLFVYNAPDLERYFFNTEQLPIEPLVYKVYALSTNQTAENVTYKQQLINGLKCESLSERQIKAVKYDKNSLLHLFKNYNECTGSNYDSFAEKNKKSSLSFTLRPGINYSFIEVIFGSHRPDKIDFGSSLSYRLGGQFESLLPFQHGVWGVIVEPYLQSWNHQGTDGFSELKVEYNSFNLSLGLRRYIPLNEKSKLFMNASINYDVPFKSTFKMNYVNKNNLYDWEYYNLSPLDTHGLSINAGVGCKINKRYLAELNYMFGRNLLHGESVNNVSDHKTISFILGYQLFGNK